MIYKDGRGMQDVYFIFFGILNGYVFLCFFCYNCLGLFFNVNCYFIIFFEKILFKVVNEVDFGY